MHNAAVTKEIKHRALELGFTAVGIASAAPQDADRVRLMDWLRCGFHASMRWMERDVERRANPERSLQGVRSVVSVALNYYTLHQHRDTSECGKVSRYAWGTDYHHVMTHKLGLLEATVRELLPGIQTRSYCDTGPVMEKALAQRAGVGWIGKHSNVITRTHGSWVFLGEVLTDADLAIDQPAEDMCGTCTACLDACPTGAIVEPYVVDARKCISYWTIEHRGPFTPEITKNLDGWLFGCDVCQDVCPWNRFSRESAESAFQPRLGNAEPELEPLVSIRKEEFADRFQDSPLKRAKREGLRRNAAALLETQRRST